MSSPPLPKVPIDSIKAPPLVKPSRRVRKLTELEEDIYRVHTEGVAQDIRERKLYAKRIFLITVSWLIGLAVVVALDGWRTFTRFQVSERIILALITSATIEVIGLFVIVTRYLFPSTNTRPKR
jgi:uncharacterized membrane protein YcjF (UPF0283 family)